MNKSSLVLFAVLVSTGFFGVAATGLAALAGQRGFVSQHHDHRAPTAPITAPAPLVATAD